MRGKTTKGWGEYADAVSVRTRSRQDARGGKRTNNNNNNGVHLTPLDAGAEAPPFLFGDNNNNLGAADIIADSSVVGGDTSSSRSSGEPPVSIIVGAVVAVVICLLIVVIMVVIFVRSGGQNCSKLKSPSECNHLEFRNGEVTMPLFGANGLPPR